VVLLDTPSYHFTFLFASEPSLSRVNTCACLSNETLMVVSLPYMELKLNIAKVLKNGLQNTK